MKIQRLKPSRIKNRLNVVFEDGSYLPMFIDDVVKNSLKIGNDVNFDDLENLSINYRAREYALRQIAISPKTETILRQKLRKKFRDFNSDELITAISPYLDDQKYIDYIQRKFKNKSNREISYRLKMAGISYQSHQDDREKIRALRRKKKNISMSSLVQRGFAYADIKSVFDKSIDFE